MRIGHLDLARYGKFTDQSLALPRGELDFHIIYGPNEAGKSTIRNAIVDLLYGIGRTSPYNFKHEYSEMCIGASIETDHDSITFKRLKRSKGSLVDPSNNVLSNDALAPFIGGTDPAFYLRMFAIDHQNMVQGGREILDSSGDLGRMLFQAAAGLGSFQGIRKSLEEEADALWAPKAKGSRAYYQALARTNEAKKCLQEVSVTAHKWSKLRRAFEEADDSLTVAESKRQEVSVTCNKFERILRVAPLLSQLHDAQTILKNMKVVTRLPMNASAILSAAELELEKGRVQTQIHRNQAEETTLALKQLRPDAQVLDLATEVKRLAGLIESVQRAERDIPKREAEADEQTRLLLNAAVQIGWSDLKPEDISGRLPSALLRAEIEELLKRYPKIHNDLESRDSDVVRVNLESERLAAEADDVPVVVDHTALKAALEQAQSLNIDERREDLSNELNSARKRLVSAFAELTPWTGTSEVLAAIQPPDPAEIQRRTDIRTRLETEVTKARQSIEDRRLALAGLETELVQQRRDRDLATAEELIDARQHRDATFAKFVAGELDITENSLLYGQEVKEADGLADHRYQEAERTAQLQNLINRGEQLRAEIAQLTVSEQTYARQLDDVAREWTDHIAERGIPGLTLERAVAWKQLRAAALACVTEVEQAQERGLKFESRVTKCCSLMRGELNKAGAVPSAETDISEMIALANKMITDGVKDRTRREAIEKQRNEYRFKLQNAQLEAVRAREVMGVWERDWSAKVVEAHLSRDVSQAAVAKAMELFRVIDGHQEKISDLLNNRVAAMRRDNAQFEADVTRVVSKCAADLSGQPPTEVVTELARRLEVAHSDKKEQERLSKELNKAKSKLEESSQAVLLAETKLKPLLEAANALDLEALRNAIDASDKAIELDRKSKEARQAAIAAGGGLTLEQLEREAAGCDPAQVVTLLEATREQLDATTRRRDELLAQRALAESEYLKIAGGDEAVRAESRRQAALAEMGGAAEQYARLAIGAKLLAYALERYREEQQGPLLASASKFFARLTNGQHVKLLVESGESLQLVSRTADGGKVGVTQMSDGTSDQLYLALRLAALELHLASGTALPFVADDLLINCDDGRAESGFRAFCELAARTQVLYFTHHQHLVDLARRASNDRVNVVELS